MKKNKQTEIKNVLIEMGVVKLKRFGFDYVSSETIMTDDVYKWYFKYMLKEMLGKNAEMDNSIHQLLNGMESS